ncbi:LacI family DNA-binding transcriptional regulator [Streptomyces sp. H10-C2]|uniref:LacI family DNA-binding transcriptional regulator n=1 Tax=unclassified Streptomyces TaxID=2593676 RepID=UPI0024B96EEC|nr:MULTISPECIES: LacI family DNA-binding transcriptional regulator [unclassified Streptomyces]MDJ0344736.1 LacI family DNA-binding transcriptional regulator [Streptomyces sp. PH10-H1]MDJ0371227.1 LacI family DNA-binding transcriptional regulator [Streptomyces sp. H10-C2]
MSRVTILDVAKAAEVSTATVSNALNGTGRLAAATRGRVRAVATALGYLPLGRLPKAAGSRTLGLAVTTYGSQAWNFASIAYFAQAIAAATAAAHHRGYALITLPAAPGDELWQSLAVDGVLLLDSPDGDPVVRALRARGLPLAFDGRPAHPAPGEAWVDNDHAATTEEVLDHLAAQGARRIALMAGFGTEHYTRVCTDAYRRWCARRGVRAAEIPLIVDDPEGRTLDLPFTAPDRPDAVYGIYDPCGHRILSAAARCGLHVPADLLVVCASEDSGYAGTDPPVSTVSLLPRSTTEAAVGALIALIENPSAPPEPVIVPARLIARRSSLR